MLMQLKTALGALIVMLALAPVSPVAAQSSAADRAAAQALFEEARELAEQDDHKRACPKFEESLRLDPAVGTQLNLAACYEKVGRTASAWINFLEVAAKATKSGNEKRAAFAKKRADALRPKLARLTIVVPKRVRGLKVKRNRDLVRSPQWGTAVPVDPGKHTVVAVAPGWRRFRKRIKVKAGQQIEVRIGPLKKITSLPGSDADVPAATAPVPVEPIVGADKGKGKDGADDASSGGSSVQLGLGITAGAIGLIGGGLAIGATIAARSKYNQSLEQCLASDPNRCTPQGQTLREDAFSTAHIATVGAVVAGVGLTTGLLLLLTRSSGKSKSDSEQARRRMRLQVAPMVSDQAGGLLIRGSF